MFSTKEFSYSPYASDSTIFASEKECSLLETARPTGTQRVKYQGHDLWDFLLDSPNSPNIDLSLVLPHYRAVNQSRRMTMMINSRSQPVKAKVCRNTARSRFYLQVQASTSDVTLWLPSDFKGHIHYSGMAPASFSSGFINHILPNVRLNETVFDDVYNGDDVVVQTSGRVYFRMWDTRTNAAESSHKETLKRMFNCGRRTPETAMDWDFLLED